MANTLLSRLDRIEQETTSRPVRYAVKYAWISRNETEEQAIARAADQHGLSAEEFVATYEVIVIGWKHA